MSDEPASQSAPERVARKLITESGILARTQILADLNLEREKDQATFEEVLAAIGRDKALATRVIQLANSAWFGGRIKVDAVPVAFGRLGTKDFYKATVAAALRWHLGEGVNAEKWWTQSEIIAHLSELVAQHLNAQLVDQSFLLGLLRDCAVPFMMKHVVDYHYLAQDALGCGPASTETERECNETDHCLVGATLAAAWMFPPSWVSVVRHHHAQTLIGTTSVDAKQLLAILMISMRVDLWSRKSVNEFFTEPGEASLHSEIAAAFGTSKERINDRVSELIRLYRLRQNLA